MKTASKVAIITSLIGMAVSYYFNKRTMEEIEKTEEELERTKLMVEKEMKRYKELYNGETNSLASAATRSTRELLEQADKSFAILRKEMERQREEQKKEQISIDVLDKTRFS